MTELFLIVQIAARWVAVPATEVESAVDIGAIVAVPHAPSTIRGLAALRSRVVTVIDTCTALGLPPCTEAKRAVIAQVQGHHYALLVDALDDVFALERLPLSSGLPLDGQWAACASGMVDRDGEPLLILDLSRLVPGAVAIAA
ncbi:chemotaxis protein CheW [Sphingomonas sp. KR1UV-12]|uniref:Chemotaxis protein CheW n=1 Tax=Sphingomonas aurea TaxID=3063994 RepID=A0ABT9EGC0_9SPHN|nr:chemotaxis protein CheW [Sphingomonas sp. KR1UV-12]MDP1026020.1 chemotaxis protein CheW [Sphingomonas sp. KR1UV-12]